MYTLFYKPGACSMTVHVLLHELRQPFALEHFQMADGKPNPELLTINPRATVPTLRRDDGLALRENGAILSWLCDEHQSEWLPRSGKDRAEALQWLMFANATLHPAYGRIFWLRRQELDEPTRKALIASATDAIQKIWDEIESHLQTQNYLAGGKPTVADILITVLANWQVGITFSPKCKALFKNISSRPSYQKALEAEHITYKAAA